MASNTKADIKKATDIITRQAKIDSLKLELKQKDQKIEKIKAERDALLLENKKLKQELSNK